MREQIRVMREKGATLEQIGSELHITKQRVHQILTEMGMRLVPKKVLYREKVLEEYGKGKTPKEVASELKVGIHLVYSIIKEVSVKKQRIREIRQLRKEGLTANEIAEKVGCEYHIVRHALYNYKGD